LSRVKITGGARGVVDHAGTRLLTDVAGSSGPEDQSQQVISTDLCSGSVAGENVPIAAVDTEGHPMRDREGHLVGAHRRGVIRYVLAVLAFGLLALYGANALRQDAPAVGVPLLITGLAGALGAAATAAAARWRPESRVQRSVRLAMLLTSAAVVVTGVALAPDGEERGFVIGVAAFLAVLLAAFALAAAPPRASGRT
jgi:hypothetical protein